MVVEELAEPGQSGPHAPEDHSHEVYTVANIVTLVRLLLVPFFFVVFLTRENDVVAFVLFALAASTDWLDGQIARRTGTVTEIGKAIDPIVDRALIASGVLGLYLEDRVPLWILLLLVCRDLYLLGGASYLARHHAGRIDVIYIGKVTTMLLLAGFSGLILNWPFVPGFGVIESEALPGWGSEPVAIWLWFVYAGVVTSIITAAVYTQLGRARLRSVRETPTASHTERRVGS